MDRKQVELKDVTKTGEVEAVVATLGVVDKDGDLTERGFFGRQTVKIVSSHDWSDILLGKGDVDDSDGSNAVFRGSLNLDDPKGAQLHTKLLYDMATPPPLIEWSYGFKILTGGSRKGDGHRVLQPREDGSPGSKIYEVSPVLVGAGEGTGTLTVKTGQTKSILEELAELGDEDAAELLKMHQLLDTQAEGQRFVDQADRVAVAVGKLVDRAGEIASLRKDGKLGTESLDRLTVIRDTLKTAEERLSGLIVTDPDDPEARAEFVRFMRTVTNL